MKPENFDLARSSCSPSTHRRGTEPVRRVDHGRALRYKAFEYLVVVNVHHLIQVVEVAAQQAVPAVAFFKISAHPHELVGN